MPRGDAFFLADGRSADDLRELHDLLVTSDPAMLRQHVSPERNDFALWVRHVLREEELARRLEKIRSVEQCVSVIAEHLAKNWTPRREPSKEELPSLVVPAPRPFEQRHEPPRQEPHPRPPTLPPERREASGKKEFLVGLVLGVLIGVVGYVLIGAVIA